MFLNGVYEETAYYVGWAAAADLVVGADGGARFLLAAGVSPDLVVGDFDSLAAARVAELEAAGVELVRHPVRKDQTDGELAVDEARRRGAGELVLAGALGALDHTLGHLAVLRRLEAAGVRVPSRLAAARRARADGAGRGRAGRGARRARLARPAGRGRPRHPQRPVLPSLTRQAACRRVPGARQQRRAARRRT